MITSEELEGICEIWVSLPNKKPGLGLPIRAQLTPDQVAEIKKLLLIAITIAPPDHE